MTIEPIHQELKQLEKNLQTLIAAENPILYSAAEQLFNAGGKRVRPRLVLMIAQLINKDKIIHTEQKRLAEITEIIHTASLVHDDIVDDCDTRRGTDTVHTIFDNKVAVLAGDFLFAQSSWYLANLNNLKVVKTISKIITDFAEGEVQQGLKSFDNLISIQEYTEKSFYKTASLIACSCKATVMLSHGNESKENDFYLYGKHLGLAFQIVDDILDVTGIPESLGKPPGLDLKNGNLTAPLIFSLSNHKEINKLINREFSSQNDVLKAISIIKQTNSIQKAKDLAEEHIQLAIHILKSKYKKKDNRDLISICYHITDRIN